MRSFPEKNNQDGEWELESVLYVFWVEGTLSKVKKRKFKEQMIVVLEYWNNYVEESRSKGKKGWNNKGGFPIRVFE